MKTIRCAVCDHKIYTIERSSGVYHVCKYCNTIVKDFEDFEEYVDEKDIIHVDLNDWLGDKQESPEWEGDHPKIVVRKKPTRVDGLAETM